MIQPTLINSLILLSNNKEKCRCRCEYKKHHVCEKVYIWILSTCSCENGKCLASIMDDSAFICDEVIESSDKETKIIPTNFNKKINL